MRKFRGATYHITVRRTGSGNRVSLVVDGVPVSGNTVPLSDGAEDVPVEATVW